MKRIVRFSSLIILCLSMNSCFFSCQDLVLSPVVGIDSSQFSEDGDYTGSDNGGSLIGLQLGMDAFAPINDQLLLEGGLRYAAKGNKTSFDGGGELEGGSYTFEDRIRLNYVDIPVLARYRFGNSGFSAYGGVQPSVLLSAQQKSSGTGSENQSARVTDSYKTLDLAGSLGVGYRFKNGIRVNLGYDHGFTNIAKSESFGVGTINNRTVKLSVGYTLPLRKLNTSE